MKLISATRAGVLAIGFALLFSLSAPLSSNVSGQQVESDQRLELPECDIFLFELGGNNQSPKIKLVGNITDRPGYDNQPWFTPNSQSVLYTANGKPDRTDVFEYFIEEAETRQVTDSINQEYSPQISPDNQTLSYVTDGATANQSVWSMKRDGSQESWLMQHLGEREPVGYYSWNHANGYILFWSRYGFNIRLIHQDRRVSHYVAGNTPPASPWIIPNTEKFSFVHQQANGQIWIKELEPESRAIRPLVMIQGTNNNYGWAPDQSIYIIQQDELFRWNGYADDAKQSWESVATLDAFGIQNATRINVSPDGTKLAIVGVPVAK